MQEIRRGRAPAWVWWQAAGTLIGVFGLLAGIWLAPGWFVAAGIGFLCALSMAGAQAQIAWMRARATAKASAQLGRKRPDEG